MKMRMSLLLSPLFFGACSSATEEAPSMPPTPVPMDSELTLPPSQVADGTPFAGDGVEVLATVESGPNTVYFLELEGAGVTVAGHSSLGSAPMSPELTSLDAETLFATLAPDEPMPTALVEALERAELLAAQQEGEPTTDEQLAVEVQQEVAPTPAPTLRTQKAEVEIDEGIKHNGDYFYRYYCYTGSHTWCETDKTTARQIWLGSHSHKSAMYIDVIAGSVQFVWWTKEKTNWTPFYGTGHWWWNFHNNNHKFNYAWDKDHGWGVYPAANSVYHWTGWHCGNDCFVATNNFL